MCANAKKISDAQHVSHGAYKCDVIDVCVDLRRRIYIARAIHIFNFVAKNCVEK